MRFKLFDITCVIKCDTIVLEVRFKSQTCKHLFVQGTGHDMPIALLQLTAAVYIYISVIGMQNEPVQSSRSTAMLVLD